MKSIVHCFLVGALGFVLSAPQVWSQSIDTLDGGIIRYDNYAATDGAYIFWPAGKAGFGESRLPKSAPRTPDSLGIVVFTHGYGGLNPLNYGAWLRHIIEQGNVVIYPRYQRNLYIPSSKAFAKTASTGIATSFAWLREDSGLPVRMTEPVYVGHSYGGVLTAYVLAGQDSLGFPPAFGAVLAAPGTSRLKGSRLGSYNGINPATQMVIVSHAGDELVGDEFAQLVFETVDPATPIVWLPQAAEEHGAERLGQGHNECYALDKAFDTGLRNFTTRRALNVACEDDLDRRLYWPLVDEMLAARREQRLHNVIAQRASNYALGVWSDGSLRKPVQTRFRDQPTLTPSDGELSKSEE